MTGKGTETLHASRPERVQRYAVRHRSGWCAVERGYVPAEGDVNVPTACGMFVVLPFGYERGLAIVSCEECRRG